MKPLAILVFLSLFSSLFAGVALADTASVSATILDQSFNAPVLLAPTNNLGINTARPTLSWLRPNPLPITPLNHYDLYLDNAAFASDLADSLTSVDFYFYSATASNGTFYVTLKTDLAQGYHTWKVVASNDAGITATSETWTFYIDSLYPFISVTKVDTQTLTWNTTDPASLPTGNDLNLTVSVPNPVLTGGVEVSSNFQIILVCPTNIPTCTSQTYTANIPSGLWSTQFQGLSPGATYTVQISATDAAGNSTIFPDFYLTYGPAITPSVTASPSAFPTLPLPSGVLTPPPGLLAILTPTPFTYAPPLSPTPPPVKNRNQTTLSPNDIFLYILLILMLFGLPLHLAMSIYSTETSFIFVPKFLSILAFPFFRPKNYRTLPFTSMTMFISNKLDKPWQKVISDIQGYFTLKTPVPESLYVILTSADRYWKDNLYKGSTVVNSCLYPLRIGSPNIHTRLLKTVYDLRIIPLAIACLTSITVMVLRPSYPVLIYAYFSVQYLFSEYLYPKISK